jgi:ligand-binding sensor domain-containing protein
MRLLIIFLTLTFGAISQVGTGQWRLHIPSSNAHDVVATSEKAFAAFENGLSEYDYFSNELSIWDNVNGLSDITVTSLAYCASDNSVFIGYENGNLDKIKDNKVTNIPAIKLAEIQGSKRIYKMVEFENHVYLATGFSIVKIDPSKDEVRDTYYPTSGNDPIIDVAFRNDTIFALTEDRMFHGVTSNVALADPASWTEDSRLPVLSSHVYRDLEEVQGELYALKVSSAYGLDTVLHIINSGAYSAISEAFTMEINSIQQQDGLLTVNYIGGSYFYNPDFSLNKSINNYVFGGAVSLDRMAENDGVYWLADKNNGLVKYQSYGSNERIYFQGPPKNDFYRLDWQAGTLAVAGGSLSQVFVTFNNSGVYVMENEEWELRNRTNMNLWTDQNIWDFISVAVKPTDPETIAVGTYSEMGLSIMDNTDQVIDTFTVNNSLLEESSLGNGWILVSDIEYDLQGNLWVLNGYANAPLKVLAEDGLWYEYELGGSAKNKFSDDLVIDYNGNKWCSIKGVGMFGYKDNGTLDNTGDDFSIVLNQGENTGALPSNEVTALAVDFDNEIWIGTDNGFAILYNSDAAFEAGLGDYNAQRIKLEFEGNVEYLLGATNVTDIEVDGGNRKWFGTANSGIMLLSADGQEILEQHTVENSPLISNSILDLEIDQTTGELFIVTDLGLVSYRTDASYEDFTYSDVKVFPNPARPEFEGPITIQGVKYDSDVKFTDVAGNLVYKTTSNGGTATWDGKTLNGDKVKSGVYLIWTAPNQGKKRYVGKVLIVN